MVKTAFSKRGCTTNLMQVKGNLMITSVFHFFSFLKVIQFLIILITVQISMEFETQES